MEQNSFFDERYDLGQSFYLYSHCFKESLWLLKQKFLGAIIKQCPWITAEEIQDVLDLQKNHFNTGVKTHLGEILLKYGKDVSLIAQFLESSGNSISFCPFCNLHFVKETFLYEKQQHCPQCTSLLKSASCTPGILAQALNLHSLSPRIISPNDADTIKLEDFLFLDVEEYLEKGVLEIEEEILMIFQAFAHWVQALSSFLSVSKEALQNDPPEQEKSASRKVFAVTQKISKRLIALNLQTLASMDQKARNSFSLFPLFWGYLHNLQELYWIFEQKLFLLWGVKIGYLSFSQAEEVVQFHKRAFQNGQLLHLSRSCLILYFLTEEQVSLIFERMGYRVHACPICHLSILQVVPEEYEPHCPNCKKGMSPVRYTPDSWQHQIRLPLFPSLPLMEDLFVRPFVFYRERKGHVPRFLVGEEEIHDALRACRNDPDIESPWVSSPFLPQPEMGKEEESFFRSSDEAPEEMSISSDGAPEEMSISQEISRMMSSMDNISSVEEIYEHFNTMKAPLPEKESLSIERPKEGTLSPTRMHPLHEGPQKNLRPESIATLEYPSSPIVRSQKKWILFIFCAIFIIILVMAVYIHYFPVPKKNGAPIRPPEVRPISQNEKPKDPPTPLPLPLEKKEIKESTDGPPSLSPRISPFRRFLESKPNPEALSEKLRDIAADGLVPADFPFLKQLYEEDFSGLIRPLVVRSISFLDGKEAREWVERIALHSHPLEDRISAIDAIEKSGRPNARDLILQVFQQDPEGTLCLVCANALGRLSPRDESIYQEFVARFYRVDVESTKRGLLFAIAGLKIKEIPAFFIRVLLNKQYSVSLRMDALESLNIYVSNNVETASQVEAELASIQVEDSRLIQKLEDVLSSISK